LSKLVDVEPDVSEPTEAPPPTEGGGRVAVALVAPLAAALAALGIHAMVSAPATRAWAELPFWVQPYPALLGVLFAFALVLAGLHALCPPARSWARYHAPLLAAVIGWLGLWDLITQRLEPRTLIFFPTPDLVFGSMAKDWLLLLDSTQQSLVLLLTGYASGVAAGIATGILVGWFPGVRYWAMPALKVIGPIPATALVAVVMVLSNNTFWCGVMLIAFVVWFPVTMLTSSGISSVRLSHLDVARTLGAGPWYLIFHVALPSALPNIFIGLFMGLLTSFLTLIVAETVGVSVGLGQYFRQGQGDIGYDRMYAALIIMALFCSGLMTLLFKVRDWMLKWQQGVIKW
jgi:NitT/TauT family transport system permease protein